MLKVCPQIQGEDTEMQGIKEREECRELVANDKTKAE